MEDLRAVGVLPDSHTTEINRRDRRSVSKARRATAEILIRWGRDSETVDNAVMIVSELVGNAISHGYGTTVLVVERKGESGEKTMISVSDQSSKQPQLRRPDDESIDGRGILLILELSKEFGWKRHSYGGKTVWAIL